MFGTTLLFLFPLLVAASTESSVLPPAETQLTEHALVGEAEQDETVVSPQIVLAAAGGGILLLAGAVAGATVLVVRRSNAPVEIGGMFLRGSPAATKETIEAPELTEDQVQKSYSSFTDF